MKYKFLGIVFCVLFFLSESAVGIKNPWPITITTHAFFKNNKWFCCYCSKVAKNSDLMLSHFLLWHVGWWISCSGCDRVYSQKHNCTDHQKKRPTGSRCRKAEIERVLLCVMCKKEKKKIFFYDDKFQLYNHIKSDHPENKKRYKKILQKNGRYDEKVNHNNLSPVKNDTVPVIEAITQNIGNQTLDHQQEAANCLSGQNPITQDLEQKRFALRFSLEKDEWYGEAWREIDDELLRLFKDY